MIKSTVFYGQIFDFHRSYPNNLMPFCCFSLTISECFSYVIDIGITLQGKL